MTFRFHATDYVMVSEDATRLRSGCHAIVTGTYTDLCAVPDRHDEVALLFDDGREVSWYPAHMLTMIERGRADLLRAWRDKR